MKVVVTLEFNDAGEAAAFLAGDREADTPTASMLAPSDLAAVQAKPARGRGRPPKAAEAPAAASVTLESGKVVDNLRTDPVTEADLAKAAAETAAAAQPAPAAVQAPDVTFSYEEAAAAASRLINKKGAAALRDLMATFNVTHLKQLDQGTYAKWIKDADAAGLTTEANPF